MLYSVAIPGILSLGAVEGTKSKTSLRQENAGDSVSVVSQSDWMLQSQERAHASVTTKKSRDASHIDTTAYSGETRALDFATLYEKFRRPIHTYVYNLLGSQEDADDLTQEVFMRAYASWNDLYDRENLSPWLYRIATNLCVDHLRRRKRISWWPLTRRSHAGEYLENTNEEDAPYLPSDSGGIPEIAERDHIRLALANMPLEYAIVLVLSAVQGVPYQEIAAIVGISPNAAATRISRAKRLFAEEYQRLSVAGSSKQEQKL